MRLENAQAFRLYFGKHKGKTMRRIFREDPQYLRWLAWEADDTSEAVRAAARVVLDAAENPKRWAESPIDHGMEES
jgi:hypothetical protein